MTKWSTVDIVGTNKVPDYIIKDARDDIQDLWDDNVEDDNGEYSAYIDGVLDRRVNLNNPSSPGDALRQCENDQLVQDRLYLKDSVLVIDSRQSFAGKGKANILTAGSANGPGVGYVNHPTDYLLQFHEIAHIYGCTHDRQQPGDSITATYKTWGIEHSISANYNSSKKGCTWEYSNIIRAPTLISCERDRFRDTIDDFDRY